MVAVRAALAVALLAVAGSAAAQQPPQPVNPGFGASLRLGYGIPAGAVADGGQDLSAVFSGTLPIQLDVGYRFTPSFSAALFGSYAFGFTSSQLQDVCRGQGIDCTTHDTRLGIEGFFHLMPGNQVDPWFGIGVGYEWATFTGSASGASADATFKGFEFVNLQLGADWLVAKDFGIGPFVQVTFGEYSTLEAGGTSTDITSKSMHEWIQLGVRGTFNL
jgi:outer membrane protein W